MPKFRFTAAIYKAGINPCVDVPGRITSKLERTKGFIRIKGKINGHEFLQTLMPAKGADYRLYVNGPMMKGAKVKVGDTASFEIQQDTDNHSRDVPMSNEFKKKLVTEKVYKQFTELTPSRQKEILRYLASLRSEEAKSRNIDKVIRALKKIEPAKLFRI